MITIWIYIPWFEYGGINIRNGRNLNLVYFYDLWSSLVNVHDKSMLVYRTKFTVFTRDNCQSPAHYAR